MGRGKRIYAGFHSLCGIFARSYVPNSDNKYVQYRFQLSTFTAGQFANPVNWFGVDEKPTRESTNVSEGGGIIDVIDGNVNAVISKLGINKTLEGIRHTSYFEYPIIRGETYIVVNNNESACSVYTRNTRDGETVQAISNSLGGSIEFTAEYDALFIGGYCSGGNYNITITRKTNTFAKNLEGLSVRTSQLEDDTEGLNKDLYTNGLYGIGWELGTLNSSNGLPSDRNDRARTDTFINIEHLSYISFATGYKINIFFYNDKEFFGNSGFLTEGSALESLIVQYGKATKIKLVLRKDASGDININTDIPTASIILNRGTYSKNYEIERFKSNLSKKKCFYHSRMLFAAHRGVEWYAPENSVVAYEMAGQLGFDYAWIAQVQVSSEGTFYVLHDSTLDRTTTGTGKISEKTDAEINALTCKVPANLSNPAYDINDFSTDELRIPTLEKALQICLRYGMKICLRLESFSNTEDDKWRNLKSLLDSYNIKGEQLIISCSSAQKDSVAINLFGSDVEIASYLGGNATPQDNIDYFVNNFPTLKNKTSIVRYEQLTLSGVKLLHSNGIKIAACTASYNNAAIEVIEELAYWGVDIFQNGKDYYI